MNEPRYHLSGVIHTKEELLEDFEGRYRIGKS